MEAGKLRNRVSIRDRVSTQDGAGQPIETWDEVAAVWADIRHLNGMESIKAGADVSVNKVSIRVRRRSDIDAGMRVYHGSTIYEIKAVLPDEQRRERLDLSCEVVNG
jgi:SPP1 family predicted phage head-tail adaptor